MKTYRRFEGFIGNVKFAVFIILLFAIALATGTFIESWHGADYANRMVYKSLWFMGIQFFMFLSILFATLMRLPFKKRLFGFYLIHSGLILIFLGSFVTYVAGVDGTLLLMPNLPARTVSLNRDDFIIRDFTGKEVQVNLPYSVYPTKLNSSVLDVKLKSYHPFTVKKIKWIPSTIPQISSSHYRIYSQDMEETFLMSLNPDSSFSSSLQLGPLNLHYLPLSLYGCFLSSSEHGFFIWNKETNKCQVPEKGKVKLRQLEGKVLADVSFPQGSVKFFPQLSPLPLNHDFETNESSPLRIFQRNIFEKGVHLFLFGKAGLYFDKKNQKWSELQFHNQVADLPWMGLKIGLMRHEEKSFPIELPEAMAPVLENGRVAEGNVQAMEIEVARSKVWVTSEAPIKYSHAGKEWTFEFRKRSVILPYEITLDNFKLQHDPGTRNPASYESFVTLFRRDEGSSKHHVFMNNPLKIDDFTFYQASYFEAGGDRLGSVLSVNRDPGRFWKYLGSFLLVFGSAWHYLYLAFQRRRRVI